MLDFLGKWLFFWGSSTISWSNPTFQSLDPSIGRCGYCSRLVWRMLGRFVVVVVVIVTTGTTWCAGCTCFGVRAMLIVVVVVVGKQY
jgi:hypothetical protein